MPGVSSIRRGDALLAEFASPVEAVAAATEIQQRVGSRNAQLADHRRMELRIGINLGDVLHKDGALYGDGVNVAARLESLAEPGGVLVSSAVREQVDERLEVGFEDMGEHEVKNIARPVHTYRVVANAKADAPASEIPSKPSIAILPFVNMSGDPEQDYFADGITEDLITEFSRFQELIVIARNSVFSYKGKAVKVQDVAADLGVRYVLEGSVRKAGERVRITAQLVEAATGHHLWAERFDRELGDVFAVQDEVTRQIVATLAVTLDATELRRLRDTGERTENLAAYDLWMRGRQYFLRFTLEDNLNARRLYEEAVALDPDYARAYAGLAWTHLLEASATGSEEPHDRALEYARKGVRINPASHSNYLTLGNVLLVSGKPDQAVEAIERGIELNPNDADGLAMLANVLCLLGKPDEAIARVSEATRIDPGPERRAQSAMAHFVARRYAESVEAMEGLDDPPATGVTWYAAALVQLGREDEARKVIADFRRHAPPNAIPAMLWFYLRGFKHDEDREHFAAALRRAGLEEVQD